MQDLTQYVSQEKLDAFKKEYQELKKERIPELARKIDDARQMGDLSENAEYHSAREEMAWAISRTKELERIFDNAEVIGNGPSDGHISVGSNVVAELNGNKREFTIVGAHDADPLEGRISNESPLGEAFLGKKAGDKVEVKVPAGITSYKILEVN